MVDNGCQCCFHAFNSAYVCQVTSKNIARTPLLNGENQHLTSIVKHQKRAVDLMLNGRNQHLTSIVKHQKRAVDLLLNGRNQHLTSVVKHQKRAVHLLLNGRNQHLNNGSTASFWWLTMDVSGASVYLTVSISGGSKWMSVLFPYI